MLADLARSDRPVGVVDAEGQVVGTVDRVAALRVVAGVDDVLHDDVLHDDGSA